MKRVDYSFEICIWRPQSLSELTPITFDIELTHLGLETSIYFITKYSHTGYERTSLIKNATRNNENIFQGGMKLLRKTRFFLKNNTTIGI